MDKPLKDLVKERMNELGLNPQKLQEKTGIPATRIYKWYDTKRPSNPKEADSELLKKWLRESSKNSNNENVNGESPAKQPLQPDEDELRKSILNLTEATNRHTIIDDRNSRTMERLVTLLAIKMGLDVEAFNSEKPPKDGQPQQHQETILPPPKKEKVTIHSRLANKGSTEVAGK